MTEATTSVLFPRQLPPKGAEAAHKQELEHLGVLHTGPEERFDRIALLARLIFGVAGAGIAMRSGDRSFLKAAVGLAPGTQEIAALARHAMSDAGTQVIATKRTDRPIGVLERQRAICFYAGQPVRSLDGSQVGTLFVVDDRPRAFSERDHKLLAELEWWVDRELRHAAEFDQAAEFQRKLMPETSPQVPGYEFAGACVPCHAVGGDFFDWYPTERGWAMTIGDVMGKGLAAAMVMSAANSILRAAGRQYPPAEAVEFADVALREELESTGTMVTVCHGELNPDTHVVRYVDAGHGLMISLRTDGTVRRRPDGMGSLPLGVIPDQKRPEMELSLEPGECVVSFSDGLLDLYDGTTASIDAIAAEARAVSDGGAQAIVDYFVRRAANSVLSDDVTVCVFRRNPGSAP